MANIYSVEEAAERLGLEGSHVDRLLRKGQIKGKKLGRNWVVLSLNYKRKRRPKSEKGERNEEC
jgi:excisionase family DNA binding protein